MVEKTKDLTDESPHGRYVFGRRTWQAVPMIDRVHPQAFSFKRAYQTMTENTTGNPDIVDAANTWSSSQTNGNLSAFDRAYNKAYSKLVEQINEASDNANEALFKVGESMHLIEHRAIQLAMAAKALRKGRFKDFKQALGIPRDGPPRTDPKDFAGLWLEYHFGWTNLVSDIYRACDVASSHYPEKRLTGKGTEKFDDYVYQNDTFKVVGKILKHDVKVSSKFRMTNFAAHTLQQYGVANPLSVAWALVPYSFVVDWFVDVQGFLQGLTDFVGLDIIDPYVTYYRNVTDTFHVNYGGGSEYTQVAQSAFCQRSTSSIPHPKLVMKRMDGISPVRAATAISLLIGFL